MTEPPQQSPFVDLREALCRVGSATRRTESRNASHSFALIPIVRVAPGFPKLSSPATRRVRKSPTPCGDWSRRTAGPWPAGYDRRTWTQSRMRSNRQSRSMHIRWRALLSRPDRGPSARIGGVSSESSAPARLTSRSRPRRHWPPRKWAQPCWRPGMSASPVCTAWSLR